MDVSKFVIGEDTINVKDSTARSDAEMALANVGDLALLNTTIKTDLVSAINEVDSEHLTVAYNGSTESLTFN